MLGTYEQWLLVRLPGRPNGHTGWISERATARSVTRLASRRRHSRHGRSPSTAQVTSLRVVKAVVGKPSTPTPTGEFFVEEPDRARPREVGAPFALALSARSNVLQEFEGGPGQIALHGLRTSAASRAPPSRTAASGSITRRSRGSPGASAPGVPVTII